MRRNRCKRDHILDRHPMYHKICCYHHGCSFHRRLGSKTRSHITRLQDGVNRSASQMAQSSHNQCSSDETHLGFAISSYCRQMIANRVTNHPKNLFNTKPMANIIILILFLGLFSILIQLPAATASMSQFNNYSATISPIRNSGQLSLSQLCGTRSNFPITKRIEGTILSSTHQDVDMNCTILLRTKGSAQHFVVRFEGLKLGCDDHLILFESDYDYGQQSIADLSCRDNMANVPIFKTTGTFLTLRYITDRTSKTDDGFRAVVTAVFDQSVTSDCPPDHSFCRNHLCIAKSLFCDGVNHCVDGSDEMMCDDYGNRNDLSYALALLLALVLIISICVIVFVGYICCRPERPYAQYQNHIQRAFGVPLQTSSSLMFTANQPQYQFFHQPANLSPFVTPQHHAAALAATLPRGYSTLPLNLTRPAAINQRFIQQNQQALSSKANANHIDEQINNHDYLMMATYSGPQTQVTATNNHTVQSNLILPSSQSILPVSAIQYQTTQPFNQGPR